MVTTPTVTTPTATSISTNSATLGANVTANGGASITSRGTVLGTSASPTGNSLAEGGTSTGTFSHNRTGLTANTLYYYRGYAVNSAGTGYSPDGTFTTLPLAPTVGSGSSATTSGFTANWSHPTMGSASYTYTVEVDDDSSFGSINATQSSISSANTSQAITGLSSGTTYYFRVKAVNGQGSSDWSSTSAGIATTSASGALALSGTLSAFSSNYGSASLGQSFSVTGSTLNGTSVTVAPPVGFEVAESSDFSTTLGTNGSPLSLGTASSISTTVYVRLAATTGTGSAYGGNISVSGGGASTQTINIPTSSVAKATPTITQAPTALTITVGQTLATATLSNGAASVGGTFAFTTPATVVSTAVTAGYEVTFTPTDTANYNTTTTTVNVTAKNTQSITFNALPDKVSTDASFSLGATASSALAVTYTSSNTGVATVSGSTVTIVGPGITTITASQAGDGSYFAATNKTQDLKVVATSLLAGWDFMGDNNVATSTADIFDAALDSPQTITRGTGASASSGADSFRTTGFSNNGINASNTDFFQVTLSAGSGRKMSLSAINARFNGTASYYASPGVSNQFAYSLDGTTFTLIGSPTVLTTLGNIAAIDLSGIAALQNVAYATTVTLRFYASGQTTTGGWGFYSATAGQYGLAVSGTTQTFPEIFTSGSLSAVSSAYGTASGNTSFSVSASNLTAGVSIQPPAGFEVSTSSTFASDVGDNGAPLVVGATGTLASTTVYVRLKASTVPGSYSGNIALSSSGATGINVATVSSTVGTKALTVTGLTGQNRGWDGTTSASATGTAALSGIVGSDEVTLTGTPTFTFANANVGTAKVISTTGYDLGGAQASYYTLTQPTLSGDITVVVASAPAITSITAGNHELTVAFSAPETNGGVSITDYKYSIDNGATYTSAGITSGSIVITGLTNDITYNVKIRAVNSAGDGAESAAVQGTPTAPAVPTVLASVENLSSALTTTYGTASSATSFSVSGASLTGNVTVTAPAGYQVSTSSSAGFGASVSLAATPGTLSSTLVYVRLAATATVSANHNSQAITVASDGATDDTVTTAASGNSVSPKGLTITGLSAASRVYDGGTTVSVTGTPTYVGLANGESHEVVGSVTWAFANKTVANGKVLTRTGDFTAPNSNYTISSQPSLSADITAKELTIGGAAVTTRAYNGTTAATITGSLEGIVSGDTVTLTGTGTFASANAGTGTSVTSTSTLGGADAANYSLTQPTGLTGTINKATQTITFGSLSNVQAGSTTALTGTSSSGLPVAYASSNLSVATISGTSVAAVAPGVSTITASQAGDSNYEAAASASQTLKVASAGIPSGLVAGWDFTTTGSGGTAGAGKPTTPKQFSANFGSGTLYLNNQFGASDWVQATELDGFGGTSVNAVTGWSTSTATGSALSLVANTANGKSIVFAFSMTERSDLVVTYASRGTSTGFTTHTWAYSTDGSNWTTFDTKTGRNATTYTTQTLTTVSALNNASNAYLRLTVTGATDGSGNNRIDNIQLNATGSMVPTITGSGSFDGVSSTYGTVSAASGSTVTVTGGTLSANITATAPTGFQVSSDGVTWGASATFTQSGGFASGTLYLRLAATAEAGAYNSQVVTLSSAGASNQTVAIANSTVSAGSLAAGDITLTPVGDGSYTASGPEGSTFSYSYAGRSANGINTSYSSATAPTAAGYYTVSATATGNYSGSNTADYFVAGPVAVADSRTKSAGNATQLIPITELLDNDRRITSTGTVETTGLTVTEVAIILEGPRAGAGSAARLVNYFVQFTPSSEPTDTFTYTVTDGTKTATATVTVTTETQAPEFRLQIVKVGTATFAGGNTTVTHDFIGVPSQTYLVEYKGDLAEASWTSAGAQSTGSTGSFSVTFTKAGDHTTDWNGSMFFQARRQ